MENGSQLAPLLSRFPLRNSHGVVFAAGGASDIVLARCLAQRVMALGALRVDLAQPLGGSSLSRKGFAGAKLSEFERKVWARPRFCLPPWALPLGRVFIFLARRFYR